VATRFRAWDDYFIPGTTVLRNKFNETDAAKLSAKEEFAASVRLDQLAGDPIPGRFDYDHMKAIHRYIFQDVYEWAGEERVGPVGQLMTKDGHNYYGAGPALTSAAEAEYAKFASTNYLRNLEPAAFVAQLAERWGELNVIHSFREGNTRSQFVFFSQLAQQAGYRIDAERFAPEAPLREEFVRARFHSQDTGSNEPLAAVLRQAIVPAVRLPENPPEGRTGPTMKATEAFRLAGMDNTAAPVAKQPTGPRAAPEAFGATAYRQGRDEGSGLGR
jgi:cell filamentation protein